MSVQATSDNGYIFSGHTFGIGSLGGNCWAKWSKVWLVKTNDMGEIEWQNRNFGTGHARTVREIDDGYILCGYEGDNHATNSEYAFLIKTDKNGNID